MRSSASRRAGAVLAAMRGGATLAVAAGVITVAGCSSSPAPTAPTVTPPPVAVAPGPDLSGVWSGEATVVSCLGSRYCYITYLGRSYPFALHLAQSGQTLDGALGVVDVHGTTDGRGGLTLSGRTVVAIGGDPRGVNAVTAFTAEAAGNTLRGSFTYETRYSPTAAEAVANDVVTMGYEFTEFTRTATVGVADPSGRWNGSAVARACAPPSWSAHCYPDAVGEASAFALDLTAGGGTASGELRLRSSGVPVAGTWDGVALTLGGERGGPSGAAVFDWQASPDRFGRLQGTFRVRWAGGAAPAETTYELSGVVR